MMLGFNLRPGRTAPTGAVASSTAAQSLFRNGEQGVIYDPNDLSTLFQDRAGTTPVTAAGQPVGLMLDKHASDGRGVVNLLTYSEQFDNAAWVKSNSTVTANAVVAPDGTLTADLAVENTATGRHEVNPQSRQFSSSTIYTASIYVKYAGVRYFGMVYTSGGSACFDLQAGVVTNVSGGTAAITPAAGGFLRCTFTFTGVTTSGAVYHCLRKTPGLGVETYTGDGTSGIYIWGAQLEVGSTATTYQPNTAAVGGPGNHAFQPTAASRPMLRQNATTGAYYLETDGSDDWMQTNAIDFTGTDKVSVFTGVRKLSDAAIGLVCELSADTNANNRCFAMFAPISTTNNTYNFQSKGTLARGFTAVGYIAPTSNVLTGISSISGYAVTLRIDGHQAGVNTGDQGTGNYGNHPLYLFRRGGITLPFNGHFYGLTIVGRLCTDAETRNVERLYANKTGVTLQ